MNFEDLKPIEITLGKKITIKRPVNTKTFFLNVKALKGKKF